MSDLDDFFAKKDKKGKKTVKKKGGDEPDKKPSDTTTSGQIKARKYLNLDNFVQDEAEWKDFDDEDNKDYSGLKIQTLSMKDKEEEQREEEESTKKEQALPAWKEGAEENASEQASQQPPAKAPDMDMMSLFRNRNVIKINDSIEFPDLGTPSEAYEELKGFTRVTTGLTRGTGASGSESISTDNKYQALKNNSN